MSDKSIAIIGAGIAGLSAGCYAQMNGYRAEIFEAHTKPGGLCTAWQRQGYTFDGCIHHLAGLGPRSKLFGLWDELGVFDRQVRYFYDDLVSVELPDGQAFTVYTDIDRLEAAMKALAPEDAAVIDEYIEAARRFTSVDLLGMPYAMPWSLLGMLPKMPLLGKWSQVTLAQFAERFKNPLLRQAFPTVQYDFPDVPVMIHLNFLAGCHTHTLGWPLGGSLAFARGLAQRFEDLGGTLHTRSRVSKILVEDDRAVGVRLARDGEECRADHVISAADGHSTIFEMLGGAYVDSRIRAYYDAASDGNEMNLCVALGVARDMSGEPHALTLFLEAPIDILGRPHDRLDIEIFNFDPTLAPGGKTSVKLLFRASYSYWRDLREDRARYDEEKQRLAEIVIGQLDKRFPGLAAQVEVVDVSTPVTVEHYTGNYRGLQAWGVPGAGITDMLRGFTHTLPGLANFHMAGQWAEAMIGISTAAVSGRSAVRRICRQDRRHFLSDVPGV